MPGIASAASKAAQTGPTQIVTSDSSGNLATASSTDLGLATIVDLNTAYSGVAMAYALAGVPTLLSNERFAAAFNWGTFQGANGFAFNAAMRLPNNVQLNGGVAYEPSANIVGGRAGLRVGW